MQILLESINIFLFDAFARWTKKWKNSAFKKMCVFERIQI